jgi:hypothetical protein
MVTIPNYISPKTFIVLIRYRKSWAKMSCCITSTPYSVFSLLNSIYFLLIDGKDESIVIFFMLRDHIPMLLGVAAKNMALLSFNYWYSCSSIVAILMKDWSVETVYRCLINFNDLICSNCLIEQVSHYCQRCWII